MRYDVNWLERDATRERPFKTKRAMKSSAALKMTDFTALWRRGIDDATNEDDESIIVAILSAKCEIVNNTVDRSLPLSWAARVLSSILLAVVFLLVWLACRSKVTCRSRVLSA